MAAPSLPLVFPLALDRLARVLEHPDLIHSGTRCRRMRPERLDAVRLLISRLDEEEPADMDSEAYDAWGDRHEELEDLVDEIRDRLEALEGG